MKHTRAGLAVGATISAAVLLTGCATNEPGGTTGSGSGLSGELVGIGASSMGAAQNEWTVAFQTANDAVTINYSPDGSGAGRDAIISGGAAFAGSDAPLDDEELAGSFGSCVGSAIDLPTYISPIALVYNVDGVDDLNLTAEVAARIFAGDITNWNDPAIAADNEGVTFPDAAINPVNRSDGSGTTENLTEWLSANAPEAWPNEPSQEWPYTSGEAAQGTSGVIGAVGATVNSLGYADASAAGDLAIANIGVGDAFVAPSGEAAGAAVAASPRQEGRADNDIAVELDRTLTDAGTYPLVLIAYTIVCEEYADEAELVKAYVGYTVSEEGQQLASERVGSAPLSGDLADDVRAAVDAIS